MPVGFFCSLTIDNILNIIVLLIIATITISTLSGNNGIVEKTITAKEEAEIKSELKVVDLASNQAKNRNKYGDVTETELVKALKINAGENQADVDYYDKGSLYFVTFTKSKRIYEVTIAGYVKYVGKQEDALVLVCNPKSGITPKKRYEVDIIVKTLQENKIDALEYVWTQSENDMPNNDAFTANSPKELTAGSDNTEKGTKIVFPEESEPGEYYLWIKVTNNGKEEIEHFGPYIIGDFSFELAINPNGGTLNGSSEVIKLKKEPGETYYIDNPTPAGDYIVNFNANGGIVSKEQEISKVSFNEWILEGAGTLENNIYTFGKGKAIVKARYSNDEITIPEVTRQGYNFDGWYYNGNKVEIQNDKYTPLGSETLEAHWILDTYTITYNLDGGNVEGNNPESYTIESENITLINPTKTGYTFTGWTGSNGDTPQTSVTIPSGSTGNKTYTANWTADTYNITLDKQSGSGGTSTIYETYETKYSLTSGGSGEEMTTSENPINVPTRSGYEFQGYYTETNGGGTQFINKDGYLTETASNTNFSAAGTLYAYWKRPVYEITLDNQEADTAGTEKIYLTYTEKYSITRDGDAMTTTDNPITIPTKQGYAFMGYYNTSATTGGTQYINKDGFRTSSATLTNFSANTTLYARWEKVYLRTSETSTTSSTAKFLGTTLERRKIKSISFVPSISGHTVDGTTCFDVSSVSGCGQVLLWVTNIDENGYYDIVIGQNGEVIANPDSSFLFSYVGYRTPSFTIDLNNLNTSNVTNMSSMFNLCGYTAMTSLDLGDKFDTSKVTNMSSMFNDCGFSAMTSLDLGEKFDTSKVTNMSVMFSECGYKAMTNLDLGDKFDTSKVTNMRFMFSGCGHTAMTSLDLGDKFDTSNVQDMNTMFSGCGYTAMTSLDLGDKFDTSNVQEMSCMFEECGATAMTSLELGEKFDTSNVQSMYKMFRNCGYTAMTSLDLGETFDTSNVTNMSSMFSGCGRMSMTRLDLRDNFNTSNVQNMNSMFEDCGYTAMTSLELGEKFDTSNVQNMNSMFENCGYTAMTSLDLGEKFDTSKVTNMADMFYNCGRTAMTSLDLGDKFDTSNVTNMKNMFYWCGYTAMNSLDLGDKFDTSKVTNMNSMFDCCGAGISLDLGDKFDTSSVTDMGSMFMCCGTISLDLGDKFDTSKVTNMSAMFNSCGYTAMKNLDLGNKFDTSNVTNMSSMFSACGQRSMISINLGSKFDTSNVTDMKWMFNQCGDNAMTSLDLGDKFDTSKVTDMSYMFNQCGRTAMTSLDLGDKFDTSNVTNMSSMFSGCGKFSMTSLDLGDKFDISKVTNMSSMFSACGMTSMTSLDISAMTFPSTLTSYSNIFFSCGKANCQVYVKSSTEKTWVETNKNSNWSNSNIIVGHLD